jgi:hypothetical protein
MAGTLTCLVALVWLVVGIVAPGDRARLAADQATPEPIPCAGEVVAPTLRLTLRARPVAGAPPDPAALAEAGRVVAARARQLGGDGCRVEVTEDGRIVVALAGVDDPAAAARILSRTGLLEIVDTRGAHLAPGTVVRTSLGGPERVGLDATPAPDGPVYPTILTGADIADAYLSGSLASTSRATPPTNCSTSPAPTSACRSRSWWTSASSPRRSSSSRSPTRGSSAACRRPRSTT